MTEDTINMLPARTPAQALHKHVLVMGRLLEYLADIEQILILSLSHRVIASKLFFRHRGYFVNLKLSISCLFVSGLTHKCAVARMPFGTLPTGAV